MGERRFNLDRFTDRMKKCHEDNLDLDRYIEACKKANKLLRQLSKLFRFVDSKLNILENHRNSNHGNQYRTIQSMLDHERQYKVIENDRDRSGVRQLLPLHRGLKFILTLVESVKSSQDKDKVSSMARTSYDITLARYHPWTTRQIAHVAFRTLPTRKKFVTEVLNLNESKEIAERSMNDAVQAGRKIHDSVENLFAVRGLLDLYV